MVLKVIVEQIILAVASLGYGGIFILLAIESSMFPIPSELALVPAGALAGRGLMSLPLLIFVSVLGSVAGALISYYLAFTFGRKGFSKLSEKYGKFLFFSGKSLEKSEKFFCKNGTAAVFSGRFVPVVRHLISLPAGFSKMNIWKFIIYTAIGSGIWNTILIYIGYYANDLRESLLQRNIELVLISVVLVVLASVTFYFATRNQKEREKQCSNV